jgi:gag-polyprotein putative aspartyl protease
MVGQNSGDDRRVFTATEPFVPIIIYHPDDVVMRGPLVERVALIDSGASLICINMDIARTLDLPYLNKRSVQVPGGSVNGRVYMARIFIPSLTHSELVQVVAIQGGQADQTVLFGRNLLKHFVFTMDGPAGVCRLEI